MSAEVQPGFNAHLTAAGYDTFDDAAVKVIDERRQCLYRGQPWHETAYDRLMWDYAGNPELLRDGLHVEHQGIQYDTRPFALYNNDGLAIVMRIASDRQVDDPGRYLVVMADLGAAAVPEIWPVQTVDASRGENYPGFRELRLQRPGEEASAPWPRRLVDMSIITPANVRALRELRRDVRRQEDAQPRLVRDMQGLHLRLGHEVRHFPFELRLLARQLREDTAVLGAWAMAGALEQPNAQSISLPDTIAL